MHHFLSDVLHARLGYSAQMFTYHNELWDGKEVLIHSLQRMGRREFLDGIWFVFLFSVLLEQEVATQKPINIHFIHTIFSQV